MVFMISACPMREVDIKNNQCVCDMDHYGNHSTGCLQCPRIKPTTNKRIGQATIDQCG